MGLRVTINFDNAEEEDVGAGENVILSMTVWRSLWNATHQLVTYQADRAYLASHFER